MSICAALLVTHRYTSGEGSGKVALRDAMADLCTPRAVRNRHERAAFRNTGGDRSDRRSEGLMQVVHPFDNMLRSRLYESAAHHKLYSPRLQDLGVQGRPRVRSRA